MFKKKPTVSATPHLNPSLSTPISNAYTQLDRSKTFRRCGPRTVAKSPTKSSATTRSKSPQRLPRNPATMPHQRARRNQPSHPSAMPSSPKTAYRHASQPLPAPTCAECSRSPRRHAPGSSKRRQVVRPSRSPGHTCPCCRRSRALCMACKARRRTQAS